MIEQKNAAQYSVTENVMFLKKENKTPANIHSHYQLVDHFPTYSKYKTKNTLVKQKTYKQTCIIQGLKWSFTSFESKAIIFALSMKRRVKVMPKTERPLG